ncbi:hypothetical protein N7478_013119 [Penicillium angulare]|uniref:uncharacterized protein n=1 Tax=Penicillium angulare TaxID=116970 RepID=UPI002540F795|nr:uncharacterized protein N7478_013119 [Penicillium angulare]KAJ5257015.1 hypothetical protein N7478_013119 [Penicillium angulare]
MLDEVKNHLSSDDEAVRAVSTMVNKTVQAMNQFKMVRKHMLNTKSSDCPSTSKTNGPGTPSSPPSDKEPTTRRKRSRTEKDTTVVDSQWQPSPIVLDDPRASKRKRDTQSTPHPDYSQPLYHEAPESHETEDISEEVQRRLRIKEERRRKKEVPQSAKRKRESMSPGSSRRRKKLAKVGNEPNEGQAGFGAESGRMRKAKKMR